MAESQSARLDGDHREALQRMVEYGDADSRSEALRQTSREGLVRRGYLNGSGMDTGLRMGVREAARILLYAGLAWLAFTLAYPVGVRLPALGLLLGGVLALGLDRGLARVEPGVSDRLRRLIPGGERA